MSNFLWLQQARTLLQRFDFYLGNALKYLWRAGKKGGATKVSDLKKIRTYINEALEREEGFQAVED
jgi:hypothetical protein